MSLTNWFRQARVPQTSLRLEALILRVAQYLYSRPRTDEFPPKIVGRALAESELASMTVLSILERAGVTKHHFGVYCADKGEPLDSYDDLRDLPGSWWCESCGRDHSLSERNCRIDVYFTVDRKKLARFIAKASVA